MTFPNVKNNIGYGLNGATGTFTAPRSGYYEFTFTCSTMWEVTSHYVEIMKNGIKEFRVQVRSAQNLENIASALGTTFQLMLNNDDYVQLLIWKGFIYSGPNGVTIFTGKYLRPL